MRRRARTVALAALALAGTVAAAPAPAGAAGDPVEEARDAARRVPFTARIEVKWVDAEGLHTAEMGVHAVGGRVRVQTAGTVGLAGAGEPIVLPAGAATRAGDAGDLLAPALERKYAVERTPGPTVAGRDTDLFVLRAGGEVREQLAIDRATGLVLRREVFGAEGRPVRVVTVLQLDTAPVAEGAPSASGATAPRSIRLGSVPAAYRGPADLPGGYHRIGAYRHDHLVHLVYSDGLHGLSLFSQPGKLSTRALLPGGEAVRVGPAVGLHYTWAGGDVVSWQAGQIVHTLVGDGTSADLLAAARSLPAPAGPSLGGRLRQTSRLVAELLSGGR